MRLMDIVLTLPSVGLVTRIPLWLTILVISRDVVIVVTVAIVNIAVGRRSFRPSFYGKLATVIYILTAVTVLFFNFLGRDSVLVDLAVYAALAITLISGLHYIMHASRIINAPAASAATPEGRR